MSAGTAAWQQNKELLALAKGGDQEACDRIVRDNLGLVWSVVRRFKGRGCDEEDLFQTGCIGLIKAVKRFDDSFGVQFSTYAVPMIIGEIKRFLRDDGSIKVSRSLKELSAKIFMVQEKIKKQTGQDPGVMQIADAIGIDAAEVALALEAASPVLSLNTPVFEEDGATLENFLPCDSKEDEQVEKITLNELLSRLKGQDRELIQYRYFENKTQTETAKLLGISQVQVSRLEKKILTRLKRIML